MSVVVQKYGGTSVETIEKMRRVAKKVICEKERGFDVVVVVSAMGKTTNDLWEMAKEITPNPCKREVDLLVSTGEQVSISLLAMILKNAGYDSISLMGFQAGIRTEGLHTKNRIKEIETEKIRKHLQTGKIVVVAGFQGINDSGDITTLGRGGSDTTAVALAAKLDCACEIYTDVTGIYTVDPGIYPTAKKLNTINYEEMMELASLGAKVMETRAVEIGQKFKVPIYVASSHEIETGTYIKEMDEFMEQRGVTGITHNENVLMVTINHVPYSSQIIANIFEEMAIKEINIDMISQTLPREGFVNLSFSTSRDDVDQVDLILDVLREKMTTIEIIKEAGISKISVVGIGMRHQSGIAASVFRVFAQKGIEMKQITTSEISISFIINAKQSERAVRLLARDFNL